MNSKFVFFGSSRFSVIAISELCKKGINPSLVVTSAPKRKGRGLQLVGTPLSDWAKQNGIKITESDDKKEILTALENERQDFFLVASYGAIIKPNILEKPRFGTLNIHPSLLPKYRGASPLQSTIISGDLQTGVTIMKMDDQVDHGPIIGAESLTIPANIYYDDLEESLAKLGAKLLAEILPAYLSLKLELKPQNHTIATYTKKFEKIDGFIESDIILGKKDGKDAEMSARKVRALSSTVGCYTLLQIEGKSVRLKILSADYKDSFFTATRVVPEGKREMGWEDFKRGNII